MHDRELILPARGSVWPLLHRLVLMAILGLSGIAVTRAASLDPAVLPKIEAATFEVVQAKPVNDPLTYEKPLPLDLLPYQERTDKYYSIGTAFAIGNNRYVTAGHVLLAGIGSLWGPPELRDAAGHVYPIGKIEKFSLRQDFVVFSLAQPPATAAALDIDSKPALNQVVYAVGNALGTGVVIRDGLYTSNTPEELSGSWKWMRFSAAASPGNSGGPLLDKKGRLIGVVLMKSQNENLNYALPISEVLKAPADLAVIDQRTSYQFDAFDATNSSLFKASFALPLSFAQFSSTLQKLFNEHADGQLKALLASQSAALFPHGPGSRRLLYGQAWATSIPMLIVRDSSGDWVLSGKPGNRIPLAANGYVLPGIAGHNYLVHLRRPDNLPASRLYGDQDVLMDQLAKVGMFKRTVGSEQIKVTSLGAPETQSTHVDAWQRRWQVGVWRVPYGNFRIVMYSLPVPDGCVMMLRFAPPGHEHDGLMDLAALTDFIYVDYEGTLAQWRDYLKNTALLPAALRDIRIDFDYGQRFSYTSKRMAFSFTPALQKITPDSLLSLYFNYFPDHGKTVWDVVDVRIWKDKTSDDANRINIERYMAPPEDMDDDLKSAWRKVSRRGHPYDGVAFNDNDVMKVEAVVDPPAGAAAPSILYSAFYGVQGSQPQPAMKAKLDLLLKNLHVFER